MSWYNPFAAIQAALTRIENKLDTQNPKLEKIMSALTDLMAALADLGTALTANNAEIDLLLTKITATGTSDADVEAAVTQIRTLIATNAAEVAKAQAAAP
jgi:chromosome segregation ATPase